MDKYPPGMDEETLRQIGISGKAPFVLDQEIARQLGYLCLDCNSKKTVFFISNPRPPFFDRGGYCYPHLLLRCLKSGLCPTPIPEDLFDKLKADIKTAKDHATKKYFTEVQGFKKR